MWRRFTYDELQHRLNFNSDEYYEYSTLFGQLQRAYYDITLKNLPTELYSEDNPDTWNEALEKLAIEVEATLHASIDEDDQARLLNAQKELEEFEKIVSKLQYIFDLMVYHYVSVNDYAELRINCDLFSVLLKTLLEFRFIDSDCDDDKILIYVSREHRQTHEDARKDFLTKIKDIFGVNALHKSYPICSEAQSVCAGEIYSINYVYRSMVFYYHNYRFRVVAKSPTNFLLYSPFSSNVYPVSADVVFEDVLFQELLDQIIETE